MNTFLDWYQHLPENIDPVIFGIGSFKLQYYGLMYIVAFGLTYLLACYRISQEKRFAVPIQQVQELMTSMIIGLILGARLGYVIFYNFSYYIQHPLEIFLPFSLQGGMHFTGITGMSYHGGLIGVIIATLYYTRRHQLDFFHMADLFVPAIPLGYTFGRIGNFINGELYGRVTTSIFGMRFPNAPGNELRHPSQLYEGFFEGIVLFVLLWSIRKRVKTKGAMLCFYLMGYGFVRFCIEYVRQPDSHIGFVVLSFSMGQLLCFAMMTGGLILFLMLKARTGNATQP